MKVRSIAIPMVYIVSLLVLSSFLSGGNSAARTEKKTTTILKAELKSNQKLVKGMKKI